MNVCELPEGRTTTAGDELVVRERVPLRPDEEVADGHPPDAALRARELDLGLADEQRRQRVSGGRRSAEVAAERAPVANLGRADRPRRFRERGQLGRELAVLDLGVGQACAEPKEAVLAGPTAELGNLPEIEDRVGPRAVEVELDHHIGPAADRERSRMLGALHERLREGPGPQHLHPEVLALLAHVRDAEGRGRADAPLRQTRGDEDEHDDRHHVRKRLEELRRHLHIVGLQRERQR